MAVCAPRTFILKNGSPFVVRCGEVSDANQLIENANHFISDGEGQVLVPGELELTHEEEIKWIEGHKSKPTNILLVADLNGKLMGHLDFYGGGQERIRHTGHFGMGVCKKFRGLGVGRALLKMLVDWAREVPLIEKINLSVLSSNKKAISLYRSFDFIECGRKTRQVKMNNDLYLDDIAMELLL